MSTEPQRITRLTPVSEVLSRIDLLVAPVAPRSVELAHATGRVLAEDVLAPAGRPTAAYALRDGFAVFAEATSDAGGYAPVPLAAAARVDVGEPLPAGTDAVAPLELIGIHNGRYVALAPVAAGEGVLARDGDIRADITLRRTGHRLHSVHRAVLAAAGIERVSIREPVIRLVRARVSYDDVLNQTYAMLAHAITAAGSFVTKADPLGTPFDDLSETLSESSGDAIIVLGGTGSGRSDASIRTLARRGRVEMHGVALSPGETAAFGVIGARPVLLIPGRLDAALAVWLVIGQRLLGRLSSSNEEQPASTVWLTRKVASPLGITEVVPVSLCDRSAEPIASGYWPLATMAAADGWILVTVWAPIKGVHACPQYSRHCEKRTGSYASISARLSLRASSNRSRTQTAWGTRAVPAAQRRTVLGPTPKTRAASS